MAMIPSEDNRRRGDEAVSKNASYGCELEAPQKDEG